jgi:hypothetical protein
MGCASFRDVKKYTLARSSLNSAYETGAYLTGSDVKIAPVLKPAAAAIAAMASPPNALELTCDDDEAPAVCRGQEFSQHVQARRERI